MAMRKVGVFGAAGVLVAVLIIAGVVMSGLKLPGFPSGKGMLIVKVMDKPADLLTLNVTIDSLWIQNSTEGWLELKLKEEPFYFDLLALENVTETLSETEIRAGNYTMIKMHVLKANATRITSTGGVEVLPELRIPSEEIKVLLKPHLQMESDASITVIIDLEPEWSHVNISHSLNLKPVLKAIVRSGP